MANRFIAIIFIVIGFFCQIKAQNKRNDSCFVFLALKKNKKLIITPTMGQLSKHGIFFWEGGHVTIIYKDGYRSNMGEIIKVLKDSLYMTKGYNIGIKVDTVKYAIQDIKKISYNGWIMKYTRYNFSSYKLSGGCYSSDVATPEDIQRAKEWWKEKK